MKSITTIISLFMALSLNAQNSTVIEAKDFKNQGEAEVYNSKKLFEEEYTKQTFEKFKGVISIESKSTIKFDDKTLLIWAFEPALLKIFTDGIFYPQLILGYEENLPVKTKKELDSLSKQKQLTYFLTRNDTLNISDFEELKFLSKSPKVKRFRFWVFHSGFMNPQVYFIELTNNKATKRTDIEAFISNAELTFLKAAWIII